VGKQWRGRASVENLATGTRNVHEYQAQVLAPQTLVVPAGTYDTLPVRYAARVDSHDGEQRLVWRNVETLYYAPAANLFVRLEHGVTDPAGAPARDAVTQLIEYRHG
jgi:hypothetical protein